MKDPTRLTRKRHSLAHLLAMAVLEYDPKAKLAIGPATDTGFYYDFELAVPLSTDDLPRLEERMRGLVAEKLSFKTEPTRPLEARERFANQPYKLELVNELVGKGGALTVVTTDSFTDLCRGGHISDTSEITPDSFALESIAGAYWRGDERNVMLTRIYGTAFDSRRELEEYVKAREEAKKRDHKKLGKELDLFYIDEEVGKGLPLWTPKGTVVKQELEKLSYDLERAYGYEHVVTPFIGSAALYQKSGHLEHYRESMYTPITMDGEEFYLRPMSCPHHIKLFARKPVSYKEMPVRFAEVADLARFEQSGELMGLIRVRTFKLTDAHIFSPQEVLKDEFRNTCALINDAVRALGIENNVWYRFSKHDPLDTHKYYPDQKLWQKSESLMKEALEELALEYAEAVGEAAFYGPKLDVQIRNVNGKEDTLITAQLDFLLPERFDISFINKNNEKERPIMIHRSVVGALERTFAFLIEHYAGALPVWLSPLHVAILPIGEAQRKYADGIHQELRGHGIRSVLRNEDETLGRRIMNVKKERIPYFLVVGEKEEQTQTVTVETREGDQSETMSIRQFLTRMRKEIDGRVCRTMTR